MCLAQKGELKGFKAQNFCKIAKKKLTDANISAAQYDEIISCNKVVRTLTPSSHKSTGNMVDEGAQFSFSFRFRLRTKDYFKDFRCIFKYMFSM